MCHYMPFRNVSLFNGIKIPEDPKWEIVMPEKWFFRENLVDFTRSSFFSQQHLEKLRGLPGPGDGRNSWNSVLCTERNTHHSDCMGAQISTRSLRKKPAEQVFRVVQASKGKQRQARSDRGARDLYRMCLVLAPRQLRASFARKTRKNKPVLRSIRKETLVTIDH